MIRVSVRDLNVKRGDRLVLKNLNVEFQGPGLYQVIGPNGSGKTTLLLAIMGIIKPTRGTVDIKIENHRVKSLFSYMPQSYSVPPEAPISVYEFVKMYLEMSKPWPRILSNRDQDKRIEELLESLGVPRSIWNERLRSLSGGMLQRVFLARALVVDAPILLLDEPLSNIDPDGKVDIAETIAQYSKEKLVLTTSHDPVLLLDHTRKILLLGYGSYVYGDVDEIMKYEVLTKFYKRCAIEIEKHIHIADWH